MRRFLPLAALGFFGFCLSLANPSGTLGDTILWNTGTSGNWEVGTNWSTGNTPGNNDSATFSVTGTYNVTFGVNPASIQRLIVSAGAVTLQSNGTLKTLGTDAVGGNNSVFVQGTTTTLNLGGSTSNTMALFVPSNIAVGAGGTFVVRAASTVTDLGTLQVAPVINGVITPSTSNFTLQSSSIMSLAGDLTIATQNVPSLNGAMLVNNAGTVLTQYNNSNITIGSVSNGTGSLTINNAAVVNTGAGLLTINKTGTLSVIATGVLNANGNILINGGLLSSAGTFNWAAGQTMIINNGNSTTTSGATFATSFTTPLNSVINTSGFGTQFFLTGSTSDLIVNNGGTMNIGSQTTLTVPDIMSIGTSGSGFLTVDGLDTSSTTGSIITPSVIGSAGNTAVVTYSNLATGTFPAGINMATGTTNTQNAVAYLNVKSGATLNGVGSITMANNLNVAASATITVTDPGSALTLAGSKNLILGQAAVGSATINVNNQGLLALGTGGTTTLNATGTININGGNVNLQTLVNNGGKINFNSGSLSYLGNLTIGAGGLLGTSLLLDDMQQLTLSGTTTVNAGTFLQVESGAVYNTGTLTNNGEMILDGVNAIANITATAVSTNNGLIHGQGTIVLPANTSGFTNSSTGEIRAEDGKRIVIRGSTSGVVVNNGSINLLGGTAEFDQPVTNTSTGLITGRGNLIIAPFTVGGTALTNNGNLALSSGITGVFGDVLNSTGTATRGITITGNSDVTFWDDVNNVVPSLFKVTPGSSVTIFGTYSGGSITGGGQMNFDGDLSPGASPAAITLQGNALLASTSR